MGRSSKQRAALKAKRLQQYPATKNTDHIDFYNCLWSRGKDGFYSEIFLQNSVEKQLLFSDLFAYWDIPKILLKMIAQGEKYDFFMFVFVDSHKEGIIVAERESKEIDGSQFQIYRQGEQTIDTKDKNFQDLVEKVFGDKYIERAKKDMFFAGLMLPSTTA